jgi:hypothetical protein
MELYMSDAEFSVEDILMEANIREFGHTISLICALEAGDKITSEEAYALIKKTWRDLKTSRKGLVGKAGETDDTTLPDDE